MSASEIAFEDWSSSMPRGWPPHRANELRFQDCTCARGKPSWHKGCLELCEARNITPGSWRYAARPANHLPCRTPALSCHSQCRGGTSGPRGMYRSNKTGIQRSPCIAPGHAIPENPPANALGKTGRFDHRPWRAPSKEITKCTPKRVAWRRYGVAQGTGLATSRLKPSWQSEGSMLSASDSKWMPAAPFISCREGHANCPETIKKGGGIKLPLPAQAGMPPNGRINFRISFGPQSATTYCRNEPP